MRYHEDVKDDMRLHNIERWVRTGWKYIKADGNPFSYITTGCYLNFLDALKTHFGKQNNEVAMLKHLLDIAVRENEAIGIDSDEAVRKFLRDKQCHEEVCPISGKQDDDDE